MAETVCDVNKSLLDLPDRFVPLPQPPPRRCDAQAASATQPGTAR